MQADSGLCRKKDEGLAWDNVAEALTAEIRVSITQAALKFQSTHKTSFEAQQAFDKARRDNNAISEYAQKTRSKYEALSQEHLEVVRKRMPIQAQYQDYMNSLLDFDKARRVDQQAPDEVERRQHVYEQAQAEDLRCYHEKSAREYFGQVAINAVRKAQAELRERIWQDIQAALDHQYKQGAMGAHGPRTR